MTKANAYVTGVGCFEADFGDAIRLQLDSDGELHVFIRHTKLGADAARKFARILTGSAERIDPTPAIIETDANVVQLKGTIR